MRIHTALVSVAVLVLTFAAPSFAQAPTGTPPFATFSGSPDVINVGNLNVHFDVPIINKSGRGLPFTYNLTYDSSIWVPYGSSSTAWEPIGGGWQGSAINLGTLHYHLVSTTRTQCGTSGVIIEKDYTWTYIDATGATHSFNLQSSVTTNSCTQQTTTTGFTQTVPDGSGYTITTNGLQATVSDMSGATLNPGVDALQNGFFSSSGSITDSNGNEMTITSSSSPYTGTFTDTLGTTALTISGVWNPYNNCCGPIPANPVSLTYTAPNGQPSSYTVKYSAYTVATNFGCPYITEYPATSTSLVSEIDLPDSTKYTFTYESTPGHSGDVTGRLASVTLPTGGTISYTYTGGNNGIICGDGSTSGLQRTTPDTGSHFWNYSRNPSASTYTSNGIPIPIKKSTTTITDATPQGNQTVVSFVADSRGSALTPFYLETERHIYQGASTPLKTTYTCYNGAAVPCTTTSASTPITQRSVTTEWPNSLESETVTSYNTYGLITETDEYGYASGAPGSLVRKTLTTYGGLSNGIVDRPAIVTIEDGSNNVKAQTTYCYDEATPSGSTTCGTTGPPTVTTGTPQHLSVTGSRGNATTINYLVSGSTYLSKTFTYYDTGNINVAKDFNGAQATYTYGACGNSFPTLVAEPLTLSRSITWDTNCLGGVAVSATDENGKASMASYTDPYFWRPNSRTDETSNTTSFTYNGETSFATSLPISGTTSGVNTLVTADNLGRTHVSQLEESPTSATYDSVETDYDSLGRPVRTTQPYAANAGVTNSTAPSTQVTYDALSRPLVTTDGGSGTITLSYSANDVLQTVGPAPAGENTKRKQLEYDALGRLTSVCEITSLAGSGTCGQTNSASGYWTKYAYDLLDNPTGVTQNAQGTSQTRSYAYDDLGRMTSETNPESGIPAAMYVYDSDATCGTSKGDLVKKVDQVGNTICFAYDALHRPTSVTYSGPYQSNTPNKYFVYDAATVDGTAMAYAKARMAEAYTATCSTCTKITDIGLSYTVRGETSDVYESTPHSGGYNHSYATYWPNGLLFGLGGPLSYGTYYSPDGEGRIDSAGGGTELASTTYNAASQPLVVTFASGDSDSFSYDPNTGRMNQYKFTVNGQLVVGTPNWNPNGSLGSLAITDPFNSADAQTCTYSHDDLSRIASDSCTGSTGWSQTFSYDPFGNISKSGSQSFLPTYSTATNQITSIGNCNASYDPNGNVKSDCLNSYAWDANGRPVTVNGVGVTYDALGRMAEQNSSGVYTQIMYSPTGFKMQILSGGSYVKEFLPMPGGTAEVWPATGPRAYYRHSDWLGSSRLASTNTRTVYYDGAYGPFGEQYANTGTTDLSFTGMNQDTSPNVYDFPAREYGIQGRWPSPDPAGTASANLADPQSWNRYAYVRNSPLGLTDPTGLDPIRCGAQIGSNNAWLAGWQTVGTPRACGQNNSGNGFFSGGGDELYSKCFVDGLEVDCSIAKAQFASGGAHVVSYDQNSYTTVRQGETGPYVSTYINGTEVEDVGNLPIDWQRGAEVTAGGAALNGGVTFNQCMDALHATPLGRAVQVGSVLTPLSGWKAAAEWFGLPALKTLGAAVANSLASNYGSYISSYSLTTGSTTVAVASSTEAAVSGLETAATRVGPFYIAGASLMDASAAKACRASADPSFIRILEDAPH